MAEQYILTVVNLSKAYNKREVIKNMTLAFFPGAKIGVIGGNGTGKSTLLRILAAVDKDYVGEVRPAPGATCLFALCRYDYGPAGTEPVLMSSAPQTKPSFHRYEDYGRLTFEGPRR